MSDLSPAEAIYFAALAQPTAADRAAYLDAALAGDPAVRARVDRLLAAQPRLGGFLEAPAGSLPPTADHAPAEGVGAVLGGRYKLLQAIGEGGMGSVFLADQTDPVRRRVAVKVIKAGMDSKAVLARFAAERQALALMDHPHIAKVLDAGSTDRGAPYFVMELVRGVPITRFCDDHRLTVPDRLTLFAQVCRAVQHAHQKGVIHRDLKPSNILVESHDGRPVPKVIDFGLAKATTGRPLTDQTLFTALGQVAGTPLYMAPEQATFNAVDVDTRADVYALGVILYELLTGTTPIERAALQRVAFDEVLRVVREQDVPTPSSRLGSAAGTAGVAACRQTEPVRLGRFVRGDLDWVVMKALAKERDRRYESATAFAHDVDRFLGHEPVAAGPPTAGYRARKFVRRNRGPVAAGGLVLLALLAGVVGTALGLVEARRQRAGAVLAAGDREADQRQAAEAERDAKGVLAGKERAARELAERRRDQVTRARDILGSVFADLDLVGKAERQGRPLQAVLGERLDEAARLLDGEAIGDSPEVARVQYTLGVSQLALGYPAKAVALLGRAVPTLTAALGPDAPDTLKAKNALASAYREADRVPEALALSREVAAAMEKARGPDHEDTLEAVTNLAVNCRAAGRPEEAIGLYERVREAEGRTRKADDPRALNTLNDLALALYGAGRLPEALRLFERVRDAQQRAGRATHPDYLVTLHNLAGVYQRLGRLPDAVALFERVRDERSTALGWDHRDTLLTLHNLGAAYRDARRPADAIAVFEFLVQRLDGKFGPDNSRSLDALGMLAGAYRDAGRLPDAIRTFERAHAGEAATRGAANEDTLALADHLAAAYAAAGRRADAVRFLEGVLAAVRKDLDPDHRDVLLTQRNLALQYGLAGRYADAADLFEDLVPRARRVFGPDAKFTRDATAALLRACRDGGLPARSAKARLELVVAARAGRPADPDRLAGELAGLGADLLRAGRPAEAAPVLRECLTLREGHQSTAWPRFAAQALLGAALLAQRQYADAEPLLRAGYDGLRARATEVPAGARDHLPAAANRLAELFEATGKPAEAAKWRAERAQYPPPVEKGPPPRAFRSGGG